MMSVTQKLHALACVASSVLTGSVLFAADAPTLKPKSTYKIGFTQCESNNPWRIAETESVKQACAKHGFQLVYTEAAGSAAKQVADVNSMIAQGVDAILLAPREEKPLVPAVMAAKKAGIPLVLLDRRTDEFATKPRRDYLTFIGSDFVDEGRRAADWLAQATNGKATILELQGSGGQGSVLTTLAGVMLLGLIFNILNFENGKGWISLSAHWQSVVRGLFLMAVVILQSRLMLRLQAGRTA